MRFTAIMALMLATPLAAQGLTLTCKADRICDGQAKCRKVSGASYIYVMTGRQTASGGIALRDITLWGAKVPLTDPTGEAGFFSTFFGMDSLSNATLVSVHSNGFMLTQHGVFGTQTDKGVTSGGPDTYTVTGPPCDGLPQGDD